MGSQLLSHREIFDRESGGAEYFPRPTHNRHGRIVHGGIAGGRGACFSTTPEEELRETEKGRRGTQSDTGTFSVQQIMRDRGQPRAVELIPLGGPSAQRVFFLSSCSERKSESERERACERERESVKSNLFHSARSLHQVL